MGWEVRGAAFYKEQVPNLQSQISPNLALIFKALLTTVTVGFLGSSAGKAACNAGDMGLILGLGRSPGEGVGYSLQYSFLENPHGQRNLVGYSLWGCKESDMTERLSTHVCAQTDRQTDRQTHTHILLFSHSVVSNSL